MNFRHFRFFFWKVKLKFQLIKKFFFLKKTLLKTVESRQKTRKNSKKKRKQIFLSLFFVFYNIVTLIWKYKKIQKTAIFQYFLCQKSGQLYKSDGGNTRTHKHISRLPDARFCFFPRLSAARKACGKTEKGRFRLPDGLRSELDGKRGAEEQKSH